MSKILNASLPSRTARRNVEALSHAGRYAWQAKVTKLLMHAVLVVLRTIVSDPMKPLSLNYYFR